MRFYIDNRFPFLYIQWQMRLGRADISMVSDGALWMDGGCMFGVAPKALWGRWLPPDRKNRVEVALNCLLIRVGGKNVLVDTGVGNKHGARVRSIFRMRGGQLLANLARHGLQPEDIDLVALTHLHFDHVGGCTRYRADGRQGRRELETVFPKATHLVQGADWREATETNERTSRAYYPEDFMPLADAKQLELVEGDTELLPGLWLRRSGGHTAGHQIVYLESDGERAATFGDLIPMPEHLPLNYLTAFDLYPLDTLEAKRELLAAAERENWLLLFSHSVQRPAGRLTRDANGRPTITPVAVD